MASQWVAAKCNEAIMSTHNANFCAQNDLETIFYFENQTKRFVFNSRFSSFGRYCLNGFVRNTIFFFNK